MQPSTFRMPRRRESALAACSLLAVACAWEAAALAPLRYLTPRPLHLRHTTRLRSTAAPSCALSSAAALLAESAGDAGKLAKLLSKDELKAECAQRQLKVSGNKDELAARVLSHMQESAIQHAPASLNEPAHTTEHGAAVGAAVGAAGGAADGTAVGAADGAAVGTAGGAAGGSAGGVAGGEAEPVDSNVGARAAAPHEATTSSSSSSSPHAPSRRTTPTPDAPAVSSGYSYDAADGEAVDLPAVEALLSRRQALRSARDFRGADAIAVQLKREHRVLIADGVASTSVLSEPFPRLGIRGPESDKLLQIVESRLLPVGRLVPVVLFLQPLGLQLVNVGAKHKQTNPGDLGYQPPRGAKTGSPS